MGPLTFTSGSFKLKPQYNHAALLGIRYAFNAAPPPPPPAPVVAPAPAPARSYLVFFDWDKYNLTDRARQIIREAAENSTRVQYTRIEVNGYTDTSGSKEYNQRLSVRRAQAVAAELVRDGVPRQAISIQGFGETHLLVPTGRRRARAAEPPGGDHHPLTGGIYRGLSVGAPQGAPFFVDHPERAALAVRACGRTDTGGKNPGHRYHSGSSRI